MEGVVQQSTAIVALQIAILLMQAGVFHQLGRFQGSAHLMSWRNGFIALAIGSLYAVLPVELALSLPISLGAALVMGLAAAFFGRGLDALSGRDPRNAWYAVPTLSVALTLGLAAFSIQPPWLYAGTLLVLASAEIALGVQTAMSFRRSAPVYLGSAFWVLSGLHRFDFPILAPLPDGLDIGRSITMGLQVGLAISFLLIHLDRTLTRLENQKAVTLSLIDASPSPQLMVSEHGSVLVANRAAAALTDTNIKAILAAAARSEGNRFSVALGSNTKARLYEGLAVPHEDGTVLSLLDVTQELEKREAHQTQDLLNALSQQAAGIGHDMKNMLMVLMGSLEILTTSRRYDDDLAKDLVSAADHLEALTEELSSSAHGHHAEGSGVFVAARVRGTVGLVRRIFPSVDFQIETPSENVRTDAGLRPYQLDQIILNLLKNAVEAMSGEGTVTVRVTSDGACATVDIHDSGPGVPEQLHETLFTQMRTTKSTGTGIGLITVRKIARSAGGDVTHEPTRTGAMFRVTLPLRSSGRSA